MWHTCDMIHAYERRIIAGIPEILWYDTFICVTWLICICDIRVTWFMHMSEESLQESLRYCDMTHSFVWHDSFVSVTYVWHDSCIRARNHWRDPWDSIIRWDSFICGTWTIYMHDVTNLCIRHTHDMTHTYEQEIGGIIPEILWCDTFIRVTWLICICDIYVTRLVHTCDMSHSYIQPIAFGVSPQLNLQSQSHWSLFNATW